MSEFNLAERFPEMRPISRVPSLMTWNGIGTTLYGRSGYDDETGTYVKTHWFCLLFVPIIALGAYRVAEALGGGWYFLGRVPLARGPRLWNVVLLLAVLVGGGAYGWHAHTSTPNYQAGRQIARADRLVQEGQAGEAAEVYRAVMAGGTEHAGAARAKLRGLLEEPPEALSEAAKVFAIALDLYRQNDPLVPDLFERSKELARKHAEGDPQGALALLETVAPLAPRVEDHLALQRRLLERLVKESPRDPDLASRLAVVYEDQGESARCEALLLPHAARLGDRQGAAILGRILARKGKHQEAFVLLNTFVEARLPKFHAAEQAYVQTLQTAQQRALERLKQANLDLPGFDRNRFQAATEAEKGSLLTAWLHAQLKDDPAVRLAGQERGRHAAVVSAALSLGMLRLQRAQALPDPGERRAELEKAEKTFLSIRGSAGGTDAYRLSLGQVYYWLGKPAEGRKLFDELLEARKRSGVVLVSIAQLLREVGSVSEARELAEEAYKKETDQAQKHNAALARALMAKDLDDRVTWLGRANPDDLEVKAALASARGSQAQRDNKTDEAVRHYRDAIALYAKMAESPATLNNSALVHLALYQLTHDRAEFTRAADKLDRAIALRPSDSILLLNAAALVLQSAAGDLVGGAIDLKTLKRWGSLDLLPYLYTNAAGKEKLAGRLRKHPGAIKARAYYEKLMVLSPRRPDAYSALAGLFAFTGDAEGMRGVRERLAGTKLDLDDSRRDTKEFYERKNDEKKRADLKRAEVMAEETLAAARKAGGATFAVAAVTALQVRLGKAQLGEPANAEDGVKLAEEAHAAAASEATRSALISALMFRAHRRLAGAEKGYAALAARTERSLGPYLLVYVLGEDTALRQAALADPDVKRLLGLRLQQLKDVRADRGVSAWAALVGAYPEEAARFAEEVRKDGLRADQRAIEQALAPLSASAALDAYWALRVAGKESEAKEELRRWAQRGVPLPIEGK
jgi:predicted Zn-dependent protease